MSRSLLAALLIVAAPGAPGAQEPGAGGGSVRGLVVSETDLPLDLALVQLRARGDSTLRGTVQTGAAGRFLFERLAAGTYYLTIRRIGFRESRTVEFTVTPDQPRDLGRIRLAVAVVELDPVVVTVERPDVTFEPDRTGYLVEALTGAPDAVVTDALRIIPDIAVDPDGVVRLRGATPAIYINGRPAPMGGLSLTAFMEQFPADQIERIEVLDAPPARFSAEGSAGVINIVLKQGVNLGVDGSVSLGAGTRGQRTGSGRATAHRGPILLNGHLNARWSDSENADLTLRQNLLADPITFLRQDARNWQSSRSGGGMLDGRYEFSRRSRLQARLGGDLNGSDRTGRTGTAHLDAGQIPTLAYDRVARNEGSGRSANGMLNWGYDWVPNQHGVEFEVSASRNRGSGIVRDETVAAPGFEDDEGLPAWLTRRDSDNLGHQVSVQGSYRRALGRVGRIEAGASFRHSSTSDEQVTEFFRFEGDALPTRAETRLTSRVEQVGAGYLSINRRIGTVGVSAGLRGEIVGSDLSLPGGVELDRDETNVFPSLSLNWSPRQRVNLRLGYSRRVGRPGVSSLDPTDRSTDPLNRSIGNPDLKSSTTHNLNGGVNWTGRLGQLSMGPYWNRTTDGWERITTVDAGGVSTTTWANLTTRTNLGANVSWNSPRVEGWRTTLNLSASRSTLTGNIRPSGLSDGQVRWSVGANLDGTILSTLTAQAQFGYTPPRDLVQGRASGQWRADMSFRYRPPGNRSSIGVSVQDPFLLRRTTQELRDPTVIQSGTSRATTRSVSVSASYTFGRIGGSRGR